MSEVALDTASRQVRPLVAWSVLVVAALGVLLSGAELMVVAIALPSIVVDFGGWADLARVSWIINAYLLAFVVAMPLAGRAADLWGARRLYVVALLLFAAGSLSSGLSPLAGPRWGIDVLIGARVIQGFGGGALVPLSMSLAAHLFQGRARAAALGLEGAATFIGMAVGPAYGAWVLLNVSLPIPGVAVSGWQWIFLLNVPIAILVLLAIYVVAGTVETPRFPGRTDLVGAGMLSVALLSGVAALSEAGRLGWADPLVVGGLVLAAAVTGGFIWYENRAGTPLIDVRLFRMPRFTAANAVSLLTGYTLATAIIGGPVFVNRVLNGGAAESAVALTALTFAIAVGAIVGGVSSALFGERPITLLGVAATAVALFLALSWDTETGLVRLGRDLSVFGVGFGLTISPRATAAVAIAGAAAYGVASALLQLFRTIGMSVGLALLTSIGQSRIDELSGLINDPVRRDQLVVNLGHPEFVGVDPNTSLALVDVLERWSRGQAADVLHQVMTIALAVATCTLIPALFLGGREAPGGAVTTGRLATPAVPPR